MLRGIVKRVSLLEGDLEAALRRVYAIPAGTPCRVWHRYMSHSYELLSDPSLTLQDVGLYNMQVSGKNKCACHIIYMYINNYCA